MEPFERLLKADHEYLSARLTIFQDDPVRHYRYGLSRAETRGAAIRALRDTPDWVVDGVADLLLESASTINQNLWGARELLQRTSAHWRVKCLHEELDKFLSRVDSEFSPDRPDVEIYQRMLELFYIMNREDLLQTVLSRLGRFKADEEVAEVIGDWEIESKRPRHILEGRLPIQE